MRAFLRNHYSIVLLRTLLLSLLLLTLSFGCGGGSSEAPEVPPSGDDGGGEDNTCNTSLTTYISNLHLEVPSWQQLECFTDNVERFNTPTYIKRMLASSPQSSQNDVSQTANNSLVRWHDLYTDFGANVSSALLKSAPPFTGTNGETITYPLSAANADVIFRSAATMFLYEKTLGRPVVWVNFYPLNDNSTAFNTQADFENWVSDQLLPEKILEAQAAEIIKAEYYIPFPIEFEIFFKKYTGFTNGGFSDSLSESDFVQLGQSVIDQIHDAVRPHFGGKLIAHLYNSAAGDDMFLQNLTYSQYDEFFIALFPQCDLATTSTYMDAQMNYFMPVVARDGLPWQLSELTVQRVLFDACDNSDYDAIEADIYSRVFDKLDALERSPVGVQIGSQDLTTEAAKQIIIDYFNSKPTAN
jgi:hypothetical protein